MTEQTKPTLEHLVDCIDLIFRETIALSRTITAEQTMHDTGCPGWTVQDQLAHMVGLEQMLSGSANPDIDLPDFDHVTNEIGELMELHVHARRQLPFQAVVDEMQGLHPRRIAQLRDQVAQGDIEIPGLSGGTRPLSQSLPIRVLDLWSHEQDMRLAIGAAPRTDGPDGDLVEQRTLGAWSAVLPKAVEGPGTISIAFTDGNRSKAEISLPSPEGTTDDNPPAVTLRGSRSVLTRLGFGRRPQEAIVAEAEVSGDDELWERTKDKLAFTP